MVGTTQRFGIPFGYGGPPAAYFALKEAHKSFRSDKEIVLAAELQYGDAFDLADESLKTDKDIIKAYEEFEEEDDDFFSQFDD